MACRDPHRYLAMFDNLPVNQGGSGRHKCSGCAYDKGLNDALSGLGRFLDSNSLQDSQAGTIRHKDTQVAYERGYAEGLRRNRRR